MTTRHKRINGSRVEHLTRQAAESVARGETRGHDRRCRCGHTMGDHDVYGGPCRHRGCACNGFRAERPLWCVTVNFANGHRRERLFDDEAAARDEHMRLLALPTTVSGWCERVAS